MLFKTLYDCWCHNPIASVALCLLSQNYQHAANIVSKLYLNEREREREISYHFLNYY